MTLLKSPVLPNLFTDKWVSDFFDNDRFFDADWMKRIQVVPAVNVKELEKEFEIEMAAPGMKKKDFNIQVENGVLTISSEREEESEEEKDCCTRREFSYTRFTRSFTLPENVNPDKVEARYEDGMLKVTIAKKTLAPQKQAKMIEVR